MKIVRIFISSPGDVTKERERAREVVESLRRRFARHFLLQPVLWEDLPLQSDMSFQRGIDAVLSEKGVDIAIFILWSRIGTPLGPAIPRRDGTPYLSGTEREFDLVMQARATSLENEGTARPAVLVYTRRDDASFEEALRGTTTEKKEELIEQKKRVESFLAETFRDKETGINIGAHFPFDRPVNFSQLFRTHLQGLLDKMAGESTDVVWDIDKQGPPFLGLEAFQPQHATVFFGREEEIFEARHALKEQARQGCAFLLLSGASGSGKSSLARAGVLPAIVELEVDEQVAAWSSIVLTPSQLGSDPIAALVTHIADEQHLSSLAEHSSSLLDLIAGLKKDPDLTYKLRLKEAFAKAAAKHGGAVRLLIVLDQLEEFFTTTAIPPGQRTAFFAVIETFARSGSVWVLATVRSDFYEQIQKEPVLVRMKSGHGQNDVLPPGPDALARIIEEPARLAGLTFERRDDQILSSRIIKDAAAHAELLPLVEFVLRELFERRDDNHLLTFAAYEELGGVEGALARRAEETFAALPIEAQDSLGIVLQTLITIGDEQEADITGGGKKVVRQRATLAGFDQRDAARTLMDAFVAARLFTTCQIDATGEPAVTIAHESLLRVWSRAKGWAEYNRDFLQTRARIAARMMEGSPLLEGDPLLDAAKTYLRMDSEAFTVRQSAFIREATFAAEELARIATRRRRLVFAILVSLTVVAMLAGSLAWSLKEEADRQKMEAEAERDDAEYSSERLIAIAQQLATSKEQQNGIIRQDVWLRYALQEYFGLTNAAANKPIQNLISDKLDEDARKCGLDFLADKTLLDRLIEKNRGNFTWLREAQDRQPVLIHLLLHTESMHDSERQYWLDVIPSLRPEQCSTLFLILLKERKLLDALEVRYSVEIDSLNYETVRKGRRKLKAEYSSGRLPATKYIVSTFSIRKYVSDREIEDALRVYNGMSIKDQNELAAFAARGLLWLNEWDKAKEILPKLNSTSNPDASEALEELFQSASKMEEWPEAQLIFDAWKKLEPEKSSKYAVNVDTFVFGEEPFNILLPFYIKRYGEARSDEEKRSAATDLIDLYNSLCWRQIFSRNYAAAIKAARDGLATANNYTLEGNLAHAYLFAGEFEKAKDIYLKNVGVKIEVRDTPWVEMVEQDFAEFRAAGLIHPDLEKIEVMLSIGPGGETR